MTIFEVLKQDHRNVEKLLKQIKKACEEENAEEAADLFQQMKDALMLHSQVEQDVVYSQLRERDETREFSFEGEEEHRLITEMLERMSNIDEHDERWEAMLYVTKELVKHHVNEEENELFPNMRKAFEREELKQLAEDFEAGKEEASLPFSRRGRRDSQQIRMGR